MSLQSQRANCYLDPVDCQPHCLHSTQTTAVCASTCISHNMPTHAWSTSSANSPPSPLHGEEDRTHPAESSHESLTLLATVKASSTILIDSNLREACLTAKKVSSGRTRPTGRKHKLMLDLVLVIVCNRQRRFNKASQLIIICDYKYLKCTLLNLLDIGQDHDCSPVPSNVVISPSHFFSFSQALVESHPFTKCQWGLRLLVAPWWHVFLHLGSSTFRWLTTKCFYFNMNLNIVSTCSHVTSSE